MMKRLLTAIILVVAAFLIWGLWSRRTLTPDGAPRGDSRTKAGVSPVGTASVPSGASKNVSQTAANLAARSDLTAQLKQVMESSNQPIRFFGKVIDQNGNGIPGVKVTFLIRYSRTVGAGIGDAFIEPSVSSDAAGRFALTDQRGAVLTVKSIEKSGYEPSEQATRGTYWYWRDKDPYHPDPDNPRLFHMWKKAGAEVLVRDALSEEIPCNGSPVRFDLISGTQVESGGDIRVTLTRNPQKIAYGQRHFEWELTVDALNGGLIACRDEQMYLAPIEGYRDKAVLHVAADDPQWTNIGTLSVYLKLRDGKYFGRADLKVIAGSSDPTVPLYVTAYVNPNGGRNLEYDPMLRNPTNAETAPIR